MSITQKDIQLSAIDWYNVLFSAEPCPGASGEKDNIAGLLGSHEFKGFTFKIERGDYSGILTKVVENLEKAKVCSKHDYFEH